MTITLQSPAYLYKNEGAFTRSQLERLSNARVLIGGLGTYGAGVSALAQLGVATGARGMIKMADPDVYERHNANRQADATMSHTGLSKTMITGRDVRDLIPEAHLELHPEGVTLENLEDLVRDVDVVVDAIDFLRPEIKLALHRRCRAFGIPVVMGLMVNKGAVAYCFTGSGPSLETFFATPNEPSLAESWVWPGSRIMVCPTTFPEETGDSTQAAALRHNYDVLNGLRPITSNSLSGGAVVLLMNFLTTNILLGQPVPTVPQAIYLDPSTLRMGTVDFGPALQEQADSIWTRIAPVYDAVLGVAPPYREVAERMATDLQGCGRVLEGGVGTGLLAEQLVRRGIEVHGIDLNLGMLAYARRRARILREEKSATMLYVGEGNVEHLFFEDESFDGYCSNNVVFDADISKALAEAYRVVKPGGILAINSVMETPDLSKLGSGQLASLGVHPEVVDEFIACQRAMFEGRALRHGLQTHGLSKVIDLLLKVGFRRILRTETAYAGSSFYVVAQK